MSGNVAMSPADREYGTMNKAINGPVTGIVTDVILYLT